MNVLSNNGAKLVSVPTDSSAVQPHYVFTRKKTERVGHRQTSAGIRATVGRTDWSYDFNMADTGPLLTSGIIFYLSIGAAIFQILEEPNWKSATEEYILQKENILKNYTCLKKQDLDIIIEVWTCF